MYRKLIVIQIILLSFQAILYFGCEKFQHRIHNVKLPLDEYIPFIPWTVVLYCLWFPLIALYPILLYRADPFFYCIYLFTMILEIIISVICYMAYPTSFQRPKTPDNFWGQFMKKIYQGSYKGLNCAPSLHCSSCYLVIYTSCLCDNMNMIIRMITILIAILIIISTMTTKQHTLIDVATALPLFFLCLMLGSSIAFRYFLQIFAFIEL